MYNFNLNDFLLNGDRFIIIEDAPPPSPLILSNDRKEEIKYTYSGVIQKVSPTVTKFKVGERVFFTGTMAGSAIPINIKGQQYYILCEGHCFAALPESVKEIY